MIRTEGEYPFYPVKPEYEVLKPVPFIIIEDEVTNQERAIIDHGHQAGDRSLQWGNGF